MWIEMNNLNLELYSNTMTQKTTTAPIESTALAQSAVTLPDVELKTPPSAEISLQLQKFQQKIKEAPLVNEGKVNTLKQQIQDRTYGILNANVDVVKETTLRMADQMLNLENDLFGNNTAKE